MSRTKVRRQDLALLPFVGAIGVMLLTGCARKAEMAGTGSPGHAVGNGGEASMSDTVLATPPADGGGATPIAQFPWPPPEPTLRYRVPQALVVRSPQDDLGAVFDRLTGALDHAGIDQWSAYAVGRRGFAIVGRLEHIKNDGTPADPRWSLGEPPGRFSLGEYIKRLFFATPGRYRVIAFLVRPPVAYVYHPPPTPGMLDTLALNGATFLPDSMRAVSAGGASTEALIYEFYRATENDPPRFVHSLETPLSGPAHLAGAGLWSRQELGQ